MGSRQIVRNLPRAQRGVALLAMLVVIVTGASWMMMSALNAGSNRTALNRHDNARILAEAKHALVGWMITEAIEAGENNPGRLPCPEAAANIGTANEGIAAGNCTLPAVGRLPWRTLGLPKLLDAAGEPLWYVVSPGWALPTAVSLLTINSNTLGQLTLDGAANATIALVVAPGPALSVQASGSCTARAQAHNALAPDYRDYLECENAANPVDALFVTRGPTDSFNDQVLTVTTRDVLPGLEAAIMKRIEREIVPALKSVYGVGFSVPAATPVYPYAAPFVDPETATYKGVAGTTEGLLPFNKVTSCVEGADRCLSTSLITWLPPSPALSPVADDILTPGAAHINTSGGGQDCEWEDADVAYCEGEVHQHGSATDPGMIIRMSATFANVVMGLRTLDPTRVQVSVRDLSTEAWVPVATSPTATATLNAADGSATVTVNGQLPNTYAVAGDDRVYYQIRLERQIIADHALLDENDATTGWFVRNEWYRLLYYAVAQGQTAANLTSLPCAGANCLSVTSGGVQQDNKRALFLLAGRGQRNQTRPSAVLTDFLETTENTNLDTLFEHPRIDASVNDRIIIVDQN